MTPATYAAVRASTDGDLVRETLPCSCGAMLVKFWYQSDFPQDGFFSVWKCYQCYRNDRGGEIYDPKHYEKPSWEAVQLAIGGAA